MTTWTSTAPSSLAGGKNKKHDNDITNNNEDEMPDFHPGVIDNFENTNNAVVNNFLDM